MESIKHENPAGESISDAELIKRFKNGDEQAFSEIVLRYQNRLIRAATMIIGDENEAMDIAQDTFVKAYFNLKSFREDSALYTWLYRILYNQSISLLRKKKVVSFISLQSDNEDMDVPSKDPEPFEEYERKDIMTAVKNALKKLPMKQRTVFMMKQFDGLKHFEIADIMGITEGAVKASYFHAIKKLRELLSRYGEDYGML